MNKTNINKAYAEYVSARNNWNEIKNALKLEAMDNLNVKEAYNFDEMMVVKSTSFIKTAIPKGKIVTALGEDEAKLLFPELFDKKDIVKVSHKYDNFDESKMPNTKLIDYKEGK